MVGNVVGASVGCTAEREAMGIANVNDGLGKVISVYLEIRTQLLFKVALLQSQTTRKLDLSHQKEKQDGNSAS